MEREDLLILEKKLAQLTEDQFQEVLRRLRREGILPPVPQEKAS